MRVVCIDASPNKHGIAPNLKEMEIYRSFQCPDFEQNLVIIGATTLRGHLVSYNKRRFIQVDGPDETEMIRELEKVVISDYGSSDR